MNAPTFITGVVLALCVSATAMPPRGELEALLNNPTSDWSIIFSDLDKPFWMPQGPDTDEYIKFNNSKL